MPIVLAVGVLGALSAWLLLRKDTEGRNLLQRWFGPESREVEGRLLAPAPGGRTSQDTITIVICAGGDLRAHWNRPDAHSTAPKNGDRSAVLVEKAEIGSVGREAEPAVYRSAAAKAKELLETAPFRVTLVLDVDPEVPFVHITGVVDALKRLGLEIAIQRR